MCAYFNQVRDNVLYLNGGKPTVEYTQCKCGGKAKTRSFRGSVWVGCPSCSKSTGRILLNGYRVPERLMKAWDKIAGK